MSDLSGKVAIVTGAGRYRGIGRATALALARAGADVAVTGTGRSPESFPDDEKKIGWRDIESVAEDIRDLGRRAVTIVADMGDNDQARGIVEQTVAELGRVDILVNNAAYPIGRDRVPVVELDDDLWHRVIAIKLFGSYYASKAAAHAMTQQGAGGSIVMVSSIAGKLQPPNMAAYVVANMGVQGLAASLAKELGRYQINVNCICPGIIDTARMDLHGRDDQWRRRVKEIPMGRAGLPEDVASAILFLCSEEGRWTTGQSKASLFCNEPAQVEQNIGYNWRRTFGGEGASWKGGRSGEATSA
ncbi:MAG: SDR family NAD(P)-dependent oxidoreductase [Dehalococcoidia bacterium]